MQMCQKILMKIGSLKKTEKTALLRILTFYFGKET